MQGGGSNHGEPADGDELAAQADRLEAALERIAALARARSAPSPVAATPDTAALAMRLDNTIARIKAALGEG